MVERRFKIRGTCERFEWATRLRKSGRKRRLEGALKRVYRLSILGGQRKIGRKRRLEGALKRDCRLSVLGGLLGEGRVVEKRDWREH